MTLSITALYTKWCAECHYAANKTIMLSVFMMNVVMLSAVAPIESDYEIL